MNKDSKVQVCDATMLKSGAVAGNKKKRKIRAGLNNVVRHPGLCPGLQ
jgi:hypothetical protein